ncbi:MAG: helix-turn-helix transcriptional regulator [Hungatella sp.]|nr:helix-turn-helix transcriptional regulator [Hungatella sp.]
MGIIINLDVVMAQRKIGLTDLSKQVDITMANLSILKNNKAKAIRFSTLEALCRALNCQPGDLIAFEEEPDSQ